MTKPRIWLDNTYLTDISGSGSDIALARAERIMEALVEQHDVHITDAVYAEATKGTARRYPKDSFWEDYFQKHQDIEIADTKTYSALQNSIYNRPPPSDPSYFPSKNAGERSILEKWQPGDLVLSDDGFFDKAEINDKFSLAVRPEAKDPAFWFELKDSRATTPDFMNHAVAHGLVSEDDFKAHRDALYAQKQEWIERRLSDPNVDPAKVRQDSPRPYLDDTEIPPARVKASRGEPFVPDRLDSHLSRGTNAVSLAANLAHGDYGAAGVDAAGMAAENEAVQKKVAAVAEEGLGLTAKFCKLAKLGKKVPFVGAVVTAGFVVHEAYGHYADGNPDLAAASVGIGLTEAGGNILGFGVGDGTREVARQGVIAVGGDRYAEVQKSDIRQLGEGVVSVGGRMVDAIVGKPEEEVPFSPVTPNNRSACTRGFNDLAEDCTIRVESQSTPGQTMDSDAPPPRRPSPQQQMGAGLH